MKRTMLTADRKNHQGKLTREKSEKGNHIPPLALTKRRSRGGQRRGGGNLRTLSLRTSFEGEFTQI